MTFDNVVNKKWGQIMKDFALNPTRYMNYIHHSLSQEKWSTKTDIRIMDTLLVIWLNQVRQDMKMYCKPSLSYLAEKAKRNYTWVSTCTSRLRDNGYIVKKKRAFRQEDGSFKGSSCVFKIAGKVKTLFHIVFNLPVTHFGFSKSHSSLKKERNTNPTNSNIPRILTHYPTDPVRNPFGKLQRPANMDLNDWVDTLVDKVINYEQGS